MHIEKPKDYILHLEDFWDDNDGCLFLFWLNHVSTIKQWKRKQIACDYFYSDWCYEISICFQRFFCFQCVCAENWLQSSMNMILDFQLLIYEKIGCDWNSWTEIRLTVFFFSIIRKILWMQIREFRKCQKVNGANSECLEFKVWHNRNRWASDVTKRCDKMCCDAIPTVIDKTMHILLAHVIHRHSPSLLSSLGFAFPSALCKLRNLF